MAVQVKVALLQARRVIADDILGDSDKAKGASIIFQACSSPFKQILKNAGEDATEWWMKLSNTSNMVPNISNGTITDAYSSGIIDPTKVVRSALQNAAAAAITLLMTECVIHEKPEEKKDNDMGGMAGFGM